MTWQEITGIAVAASVGTSGAVTLILKYIFQKNIDAHVENLKHDLQKEAFNAEMIITERHKIYSELTEYILKAEGLVQDYYDSYFGASYRRTYEEYNDVDFKNHFKELKVTNKLQSQFFQLYNDDPAKAIKWWRGIEDTLNGNYARQAIDNAKNFYLIKKIYLTVPMDEKAWLSIQCLYSLLRSSQTYLELRKQLEARNKTPDSDRENKVHHLAEASKQSIKDLIKGMRASIATPIAKRPSSAQ